MPLTNRPSAEFNTRCVRLLRKRVRDLEGRIEDLQDQLAAIESRLPSSPQEMCPQCRSGRLLVVETQPHPEFSFAGIETHEVRCDHAGCDYTGTRLYDPNAFLR